MNCVFVYDFESFGCVENKNELFVYLGLEVFYPLPRKLGVSVDFFNEK
jgi:hypothetical protein